MLPLSFQTPKETNQCAAIFKYAIYYSPETSIHLFFVVVKRSNQSHRTSSGSTSDNHHLDAAPTRTFDIIPSSPACYNTGFGVPEGEERYDHDTDRDIEAFIYIIVADTEIRDKWQESAQEISYCNSESRRYGTRWCWLLLAMLELHHEVDKAGGFCEMSRKIFKSLLGEVVGRENFGDVMQNVLRIGGYKLLRFLFQGFVRGAFGSQQRSGRMH